MERQGAGERRYIAQALSKRKVATIEITIDPMMPTLLEKKKNMSDLAGDNILGALAFLAVGSPGNVVTRTRSAGDAVAPGQ